jgi:butyryl-CoA dehydrogenase
VTWFAIRRNRSGTLRPSVTKRNDFDRALMFDRLAELGLTGIVFPEEYGGAGADYISYAIAVEELSRVCASTGVTLSAHLSLGANPIYLFGSEEQKTNSCRRWPGRKMGAFGLTEPRRFRRRRHQDHRHATDDSWILNGTKIFITNAGEAETYVVFARTDKNAQKHHGISAFIVEREPRDFPSAKREAKMGIRSAHPPWSWSSTTAASRRTTCSARRVRVSRWP